MLTANSSPVRSLIPLPPTCNEVRVAISSAVIESPLDLFKASLNAAARLASGILTYSTTGSSLCNSVRLRESRGL